MGRERRNRQRESTAVFTRMLSSLKQRGSGLLVVGSVPEEVHVRLSRQMLGDPNAGPRYRLIVGTDASCESLLERVRVEPPNSPETTLITKTGSPVRSATTAESVVFDQIRRRYSDGGLDELGITISDSIEEIERRADGFEPAEFRLCFDSLTPLVDQYESFEVFQFLHLLVGQIRFVHGIGHFHLPVTPEACSVRMFEPLFDGVVELRYEDGVAEQCWRLRNPRVRSEWLPVDWEGV